VVQRCENCGHHQHYPRPFCVACLSDELRWAHVSGRATIYSLTRNWLAVDGMPDPPYVVALVDLDEGPRLLTNLIEDDLKIGDRVQVAWRARADAPPVPVFRRRLG